MSVSQDIRIKTVQGEAIRPYVDDLAALRIEIFREFPYLYDGSLEYEQQYLNKFIHTEGGIMVLALDGRQVIGASTGLPLREEVSDITRPFLEMGYHLDQVFYFSESVLRRSYRGQGIGRRFFEERESYVRAQQHFDKITFCAVERPEDHPRRPNSYRPLDRFWQKQGFWSTEMICLMSWKDLDEATERAKPLRFWIKNL